MNEVYENLPEVPDEIQILASLVPLENREIIELGCGEARLARELLLRYSGSRVTALEVDERQHAKNLAAPQERLVFVSAGAESVPFPDASFDLALMLKSLHHVPMALHAQALAQVARVLRPDGHLYVSEPVYGGEYNEVIRLFHDERVVRAAAQAALDEALRSGTWTQLGERRFVAPVAFAGFADFEQRTIRATFADHRPDDATLAKVRAAFERHAGPDGSASFAQPMHVRLLQRK